MPTSNEEFFDAMVRHQIGLSRLSGSIRNQTIDILDKTEHELKRIIRRATKRTLPSNVISPSKLNALKRDVKKTREKAWEEIALLWALSMTDLVKSEPEFLAMATKTTLPVRITPEMPTTAALIALLAISPFDGRLLADWAKTEAQKDIDRIISDTIIGVSQGESSNVIASRTVGTTALNGQDGKTQVTRNAAAGVVVTMITHFSNQAKRLYYIENGRAITKERYTAILDGNTTKICLRLNGMFFLVGEGYFPPVHRNCRSVRIAVFDGKVLSLLQTKPSVDRQLLKEYTNKNNLSNVSSRGALPRGHMGTFDDFRDKRVVELIGGPPELVTTQQFFERQTRSFQNESLGITGAKLWRDGGLTIDRFTNRVGDNLTLSELAISDRNAFIKAGLDPDDF